MSVSLAKFVAEKFDLDVNDVIETFAEYKQKSARGPKKDDWEFLQEMHDSVLASHKLSHPDPIDTVYCLRSGGLRKKGWQVAVSKTSRRSEKVNGYELVLFSPKDGRKIMEVENEKNIRTVLVF